MSKLVLLNLGRGTLQDGFPSVTVQLQSEGNPKSSQFHGSLPPATNILHLYRRWQLLYDLLYQARSINIGLRQPEVIDEDIEFDQDEVTHVSEADFYNICHELQTQLDNWLDFEDFRNIDRQLRMRLVPDDEIRFIIQTEDTYLRKVPWHIWRFFRDYPRSEIALSAIEFDSTVQIKNSVKRVKIIAVLGDSTGIDVETDRKLLLSLPDAKTVFLPEPSRRELDEKLWDKQGWDILFFAGHSCSHADGETGYIYINSQEKLAIPQLRNALKKAKERGLQLAIFNSCDGLGLAQQLGDLHIPQIIIMREPVPDQVAQEFLKYFLKEFSDGKSLYLAFREAREKLQGLESNFPGASWLPIIFQNPAEISPTWTELRDKTKRNSQLLSTPQRNPILSLKNVLIASFAVTSLLMFVRSQGVFQPWELKAYDHLLVMRQEEGPDQHILVVGIQDKDLELPEQKQRRPGTNISDEALEKLLEKLESNQASAIGLDIIRDFPVDDKYSNLKTRLQKSDRIYAGCFVGGLDSESKQIAAPPEIKKDYQGFMDFTPDSDDVVRRNLLSMDLDPTSPCRAEKSLGLVLAFDYLQQKGLKPKMISGNWQIGSVVFNRLQTFAGGYQKEDTWGNQILLNYRSYRSPDQIVSVVSLTQVLGGLVPQESIKDKIVIVGVMTSNNPDRHSTPYNKAKNMPGVILQAQMTSQILNAVLYKRPLIWFLPIWGELLWVWGWSAVGGVLAYRYRSIYHLLLATTIAIAVLYGVCFALLQPNISCWVPLLPPAIALVITEGALVAIVLVRTRANSITT